MFVSTLNPKVIHGYVDETIVQPTSQAYLRHVETIETDGTIYYEVPVYLQRVVSDDVASSDSF